jgi:hypothetical protein
MEIENRIQDLEAQTEADQNLRIEERRKTNKALQNFQRNSSIPDIPQPPSTQKRGKYQKIPPEIRALVAKNVFSVWRIINAEKKRAIEGEPSTRPQKRGHKSPLVNPDILIFDEITALVSEKFRIETSASAIKAAIPEDWNKDSVLQAQIVYVRDLEQEFFRNIVYVDEKPWNMHKKKSKGHALRGEPAKLTLVPKGKNITMIAALSKFTDKKKGTTAEDFRNFIIDLLPKIPRDSTLLSFFEPNRIRFFDHSDRSASRGMV